MQGKTFHSIWTISTSFGLADAINFYVQTATELNLVTCVDAYREFNTTNKNSAKLAAFYAEHLDLQFTSP